MCQAAGVRTLRAARQGLGGPEPLGWLPLVTCSLDLSVPHSALTTCSPCEPQRGKAGKQSVNF